MGVAAHPLRARCLHAAAGTSAARAAEQTGDLQPTLSHQHCHATGDRSRSPAPRSRNGLLRRAPHLGPATAASSPSPLCAGRWRPRSESLPLNIFPLAEPRAFASGLRALFRHDWAGLLQNAFRRPRTVLLYLGAYTHRVAISNSRLVALSEGNVTFRWRDSAHGNSLMQELFSHRNERAHSR